ncbi:hypothetical protein ACFFLM_25915 [Deinococcus oregonensis]|uniref:Uncharacterized protein n=1 Tax=Deinococcus oregonensis TaxID=1805970 RepID=A0ABV6B6I0_9DEIO
MLGWTIAVIQLTPEKAAQLRGREETQAVMLAYWEAGVSGIRWLEQLMAEGKATQVRSGGYPNRYVMQAGELLPLLADPASLPEVRGQVALYPEHLEACPETATLTIDVWDQS